MNAHQLVILILGVGFSVFLFAPPSTLSALLKIEWKSRLWARLIGIFGFLFIALGLLTNEFAQTLALARVEQSILLGLKHFFCGLFVGLLLAMMTKRFEDR